MVKGGAAPEPIEHGEPDVMEKWVDLTQPFYNGMSYIKVFNPPRIESRRREIVFPEGKDFLTFSELTLVSHMGTHVDAPRHMFGKGKTLEELPLSAFFGEGVVIPVPKGRREAITAEDISPHAGLVREGDILFLNSGWWKKFGSDEYHDHPYIHISAARWMVERRIKMMGVDMVTVDLPVQLRDKQFNYPIHRLILGKEMPIVECLGNLDAVSGKRLFIHAFPIKIKEADGAPARVLARILD